MDGVERGAGGDVDAVAGRILEGAADRVDCVPDFALQADVGDQAVAGLGVGARLVAGVRVPVGVAVDHLDEQERIVADGWVEVRQGICHGFFLFSVGGEVRRSVVSAAAAFAAWALAMLAARCW
ncbi:unannotated protein [freshwater metagenome]|uniref:Unannotated protein n=1 Tax=freshwater metagenome TaxID=449393 RepID=A0A6J7F1V6_9ZZZZ